jgi:pantetheine-phosphate adenylyltransferase
MDKRIALFPGSFDPFHKGHHYVVNMALQLFDEVYICLAINPNKKGYFEHAARVGIIETIFKSEPRVKIVSTHGLVCKKAQEIGASFIIKGARNGDDFTDEATQSDINWKLGKIPTLIIPTPNVLSHISSSAIRSILQTSKDTSLVKDMMC